MKRTARRALLVFVLLLAMPVRSAADSDSSSEGLEAAILKASGQGRLLLVFSRPEQCRLEQGVDPCSRFEKLIAHPAMQRRMRSLLFHHEKSEAGIPAITLYDFAGKPASIWPVAPSLETFTRILALIETARPHLIAAHEALRDGDSSAAIRSRALAMLALGKESEGREFLDSLHMAGEDEDRELTAIWLAVLDSGDPNENDFELLEDLGGNGVSERVRFEAWSAAGRIYTSSGMTDEATEAYRKALATAPEKMRDAALAALRQAEERAALPLGLSAPGSVVAGRRTVQPRSVPQGASRVEFRLDGELVRTATRAPFIASVNFGRVPRPRVLEITVLDTSSKVLGRSRTAVNQNSDDAGVYFLQPSSTEASGEVPLAVAVQLPQRSNLESVVIEWNREVVASFSSPPFETSLRIGKGEAGVLRAVLRLDDGTESEAALLMNSGAMALDSNVNLVELPVYSDIRTLRPSDVTLREDGRPRVIDRIIPAEETPLRIALVLDTSSSMEDNLLDVQEAAIRFLETSVTSQDRVMLLTFGGSMRILWPTGDRTQVERAILQMQPSGGTPLREAIVTALLQIPTTGARRALVVFSDGLDTGSNVSRDDLAEVARRSGVPIYVLLLPAEIGYETPRSGRNAVLVPSARERAQREQGGLRKLSEQSGGRVFKLGSFDELDTVWNAIAEDLANQSLVLFRTGPSDKEWRAIEVSLNNRGKLRAPLGIHVGEVPRSTTHDN